MVKKLSKVDSPTTAVAVVNEDMFNKWLDTGGVKSIMTEIFELKPYNPKPGTEPEKDKAWMIRVTLPHTRDNIFIEWPIKVNILRVSKVKQGNVPMLDRFWEKAMNNETGKYIEKFFFTNEFSVFASKDTVLSFKMSGKDSIGSFKRSDLEAMLSSKLLNGNNNMFYKEWEDSMWKPYKSSYIKDSYVIYWVMIDGPYAWEYFRTFLSQGSFGKTWSKEKGKIDPLPWTLQYAVNIDWLKSWNQLLKNKGKEVTLRVNIDQCDLVYDVAESETTVRWKTSIKYLPDYTFDNLTAYRWSNIEQVVYIEDLCNRHFAQQFNWVKAALPIQVNWIDTKASLQLPVYSLEWSKVDHLEWELDDEDVEEVFPSNVTTVPQVSKPSRKILPQEQISVSDLPF